MTFKTDFIGAFMQWTKRVVADPAAAEGAGKQWFEDAATAEAATANNARGASAAEGDEHRQGGGTGAGLVAAMQASPFREVELTATRARAPERTVDL